MSVINKLLDKISDYIKLKGEKLKLDIIKHVSRLLAHFVGLLLIGVFAFFFIFFGFLGLSAYLNEVLESTYLGFLIVAGFYLVVVVLIILLLQSNKLQNWLEVLFIKIAQSNQEEDE